MEFADRCLGIAEFDFFLMIRSSQHQEQGCNHLRRQYQLALAQYDAAIERFPADAVGYNGRAETLRALGRLTDALAQYDTAIERFPANAFGYTGRAETLRALGQLESRPRPILDAAIERFPANAFGYRGRAETLRALGRLSDALRPIRRGDRTVSR